jgi:Tfp pilus assembly protein PilF
MDAKDLIAQGITLARRGQNEKARELFNLALITDPRSENAWMWLSSVAMDDAEKEDCLRQVLAINPKNVSAANELQKLSEKRRNELAAKVAALAAARSAIETPKVEAAALAGGAMAARRRGGRAQMPAWLKYAFIGGFRPADRVIALGSSICSGVC